MTEIPDEVVTRAFDEISCRDCFDDSMIENHYIDIINAVRAAGRVFVEWESERICKLIIKRTHPPRGHGDDYNDQIADEGEALVGLIRSRSTDREGE